LVAYQDRSIGVTDDALTIKGYYLPGTVKRVPLTSIRSVRRAATTGLRGRGRIWGTANPGYWANFDPGRSHKTIAFLVDVGRSVQPFVTPDDPEAFESALRERGVEVTDSGSAPLI
jgi:hypothetical protein